MTKELSKHICEKCGIKPYYKYIVRFNKDNSPLLTVTKDFFDIENKSKYKVTTVIKEYPDFGEPENFVKLMELRSDSNTTILKYLSHSNVFSTRKGLLKALIDFLELYLWDDVPKAIREAEWRYE